MKPLTASMHEKTEAHSVTSRPRSRVHLFCLSARSFETREIQDARRPWPHHDHEKFGHKWRESATGKHKTKQTPVSQTPFSAFQGQCDNRILLFPSKPKKSTPALKSQVCTGIHEQRTELFHLRSLQHHPPILILFRTRRLLHGAPWKRLALMLKASRPPETVDRLIERRKS